LARPPLILASASPRRRELLESAGLRFSVVPSDAIESIREGEAPDELVRRLAREKAAVVAERAPDAVILAADTVVALGAALLEKPVDGEDARRMLRALSGKAHQVWTGVAIADGGRLQDFCVRTEVRFRDLSDEEIGAYVASGEPMDKAGAYGIQGRAAAFVVGIQGSYTNVVGLPLAETLVALRAFAIVPSNGGPDSPPS